MVYKDMSGYEFEDFIASFLKEKGFSVKQTDYSNDGGVDLICYYDKPLFKGKYLIQCKNWKGSVGQPQVRDLYGVTIAECANKGILITTSDFTNQAYAFAKGKNIELVNGKVLESLLGDRATLDCKKCDYCGNYHTDENIQLINDKYVCTECFNSEQFDNCTLCNKRIARSSLRKVDVHQFICNECFSNGKYESCSICGGFYSDLVSAEIDLRICHKCIKSSNFNTCNYCGRYYHYKNLYLEESGKNICRKCGERAGLKQCKRCNNLYKELIDVDGTNLCKNCSTELGYEICDLCGRCQKNKLYPYKGRNYCFECYLKSIKTATSI